MKLPPARRFWAKVHMPRGIGGCWEWIGARVNGGYGRFHADMDNPNTYSHRWAFERLVGPIPAGLDIDHLCRNRSCVNPAHLEPVTRRTNLLRGETLTAAHHEGRDCGFAACRSCERHRKAAA